MTRLTIAHKNEASFRNRQGLRRGLVKKLPKGIVGVATERKLLDSDCESCKATTSAAKAALAYAKKVRNKLEKMAHLPLMSEDEGDDETEVEVEEEDPDADHVPLGGRGPEDPPDGAGGLEGRVGTVFSLEGGGTGSVPSRKHPTMEVILDSGASHNVLPERVFWRLYEQGRATPLKKVSFPRRFSTASGESLPNLGTTEWDLALRSGYPVQVQLQTWRQSNGACCPLAEPWPKGTRCRVPLSGCFLRTLTGSGQRKAGSTRVQADNGVFKGLGEAFAALVGGEPKGKEP